MLTEKEKVQKTMDGRRMIEDGKWMREQYLDFINKCHYKLEAILKIILSLLKII